MKKFTSQVWGNLFRWNPGEVAYPENLDQLRQAISDAKKRGVKIRAVGSLHSMNELCQTSGLQLYTDRLNKILELDKAKMTVKVEGGIKIKDLLEILAKEGLTMPNQGYIEEQSIAGAIATATHGSGKTGTFCSFVQEIELLDAHGDLHVLTPETTPHLFSAALVHLGCLGIVYSLKLTCIPLSKLELSKVRGNLEETLKKIPDFLQEYDYFQLVIDPYSDQVFTWRYKKTEGELKNRGRYQFWRNLIKFLAIINMDYLHPPYFVLPYLLKIYMFLSPFRSCIDYSHRILSPADEGHYVEEEIAVPYEHFEEALAATRKIIDEHGKRKKRMLAIILIRFANADPNGYLSPAHDRKTVYISLITIAKAGYVELFKDVENALYPFGGRPHWGKVHYMTKDIVQLLYPENYTKFIEARNKLDPEGLFSNEYVENLLL